MGLSHRVTELMEESYNIDSNAFSYQNKDGSGRIGMNTVFGETVVGQRIPSISAQFMYGIDTRAADDLSANGGNISFANAMLSINSGTASNGDGLIQSKGSVRYIPGHESYAFFTTVFDEPAADNTMKAGLFEESNGFWIGYIDTTFGFCRVRDGVENFIAIDDFDIDIVTGHNQYNFILDPQKGNVWKISYGYLGFAIITLEVLTSNGQWMRVHTIKYPNMYTVTHITNTYLPLRGRSINSGNTTNKSVKIGSVSAGIIDGGSQEITGRRFSASLPAVSTGTDTLLVLFRNKSTFNSIENHIQGFLDRVSFSTDGAAATTIKILKNPVITNTPTWTDVDANNSTHEYSTDATLTLTSAEQVIAFELFKTQNYVEKVREYNINLYPGETAAFIATGNNSVKMSINWTENF